MATIMDSYEEKVGNIFETKMIQSAAIPVSISTTLYDLIAAIQDAVGPGDDTRVVATVVQMLEAGYITFPGDIDLKIQEHEGEPAMQR